MTEEPFDEDEQFEDFLSGDSENLKPLDHENKGEVKKYLRILLDGMLNDAHSSDFAVTTRSFGTIEGILLAGMASGVLNAEDMDEYTDRIAVIQTLKEESVLPMKPFFFVPNNPAGKRWLISLKKKLDESTSPENYTSL